MRNTGASVLLRVAVPPGDEVPTGQAVAAVPGVCGSDEGEKEIDQMICIISVPLNFLWHFVCIHILIFSEFFEKLIDGYFLSII